MKAPQTRLLTQACRRSPRRGGLGAPSQDAETLTGRRCRLPRLAALAGLMALAMACAFGKPTSVRAQLYRAAVDNGGLGLLPIGDQYPIKLKFLTFAPEPVLALPASTLDISYQLGVANTIVNTQFSPQNGTPAITQARVNQGLTAANFPSTGYGAYIRAETYRQLIRIRYGLGDGVEVGLDQAWVSFNGGVLDPFVNSVEGFFGGSNPERHGFAINQFRYYLYNNGHPLIATSAATDPIPQDPVFSLKWNLSEGTEVLPAFSIRLAYKSALDSAESLPRSLVSSGHDDYGYSFMFSKAIGRFVAHLQVGESQLGGTDGNYVPSLQHQFFGLEYRANSQNSLVVQTSHQPTILNVGNVSGNSTEFAITRPADVLSAGYKYVGKVFHMDLGFSEDYVSRDNTTDIVIFFDLGWRW